MFQSLLYVIVRVSEHSLARQDYVARLPIAARTTARPVARTPRRPFGHKASPPLARQAVARPRGAGGGGGTLKVRCGGVRRGEMTPEGSRSSRCAAAATRSRDEPTKPARRGQGASDVRARCQWEGGKWPWRWGAGCGDACRAADRQSPSDTRAAPSSRQGARARRRPVEAGAGIPGV